MKELSIEEKAKRYDQVAKEVKDFFEGKQKMCSDVTKALENLFPELKESKEERIRRGLLESFKYQQRESHTDAEWLNGIKLSEVVSWLEKQKEITSDEASSNKNTSTKNKKKYILTGETIEYRGHRLYRIKAIKSFSGVRKGSLGGWVESEDNLSQEGDCWIFNEAKVFRKANVSGGVKVLENACIYGNAVIFGYVVISGNAKVYGNVCIYGNVSISGYAKVFGSLSINSYACIRGDAIVKLPSDYAVFENIWGTSDYFTWTRSNNMWEFGHDFYGTGQELIKKGYKDSELTGKCYEAIVKAQEEILKITNKN
jgi:hypothetical protein